MSLYLLVASNAWAKSSSPVVTQATAQFLDNPIAVTAHGKYVWVDDDSGGPQHNGAIYRIDVATGRTVPIYSSRFDRPLWIYSNGVDLWIANGFGNPAHSLLMLNIATNHLSRFASKGVNGPIGITSSGKYLWLLNGNGGSSVTRINLATGAFTTNDSIVTARENSITADNTSVWVAEARPLTISVATNKVKVIDPNRLTNTSKVVSNGGDLWFLSGNRHLIELDEATGALRSFYNPAFEFSPNLAPSGKYVWMSDYYHNKSVLRFDVATGTITKVTSPFFSSYTKQVSPYAMASEGSSAWVTVTCSKLVQGQIVSCGSVDKVSP